MSKRKLLPKQAKKGKALQSDVDNNDAIEHLTFVQSISASFRGYTQQETASLAEHFSVMRFEAGQTVIAQGEAGTWFGAQLIVFLRCTMHVTPPARERHARPLSSRAA